MKKKIVVTNGHEKTEIEVSTDGGYFSVTAETWEHTRRGWRWFSGGCLHDLVLKLRPELRPLVALHLSNLSGVPMYSIENGFYWISGAAGGLGERFHGSNDGQHEPNDCINIAADHFRASRSDILALIEAAKVDGKKAVERYCLANLARWQNEADAAMRQIEGL